MRERTRFARPNSEDQLRSAVSVALQNLVDQLSFVAEELTLATSVLSVDRQFEESRKGKCKLVRSEAGPAKANRLGTRSRAETVLQAP